VSWGKGLTVADKGGGPRKPYSDNECDHDYNEDEDALEWVCVECNHRTPMDLRDLLK
jgi:hypothetical protein